MSHFYALLMNRLSKTQSGIFMSYAIPLLSKDTSSSVYIKLFLLLQMAESISNPQICRYSGKYMVWVLIRSASYAHTQHILKLGMETIT